MLRFLLYFFVFNGSIAVTVRSAAAEELSVLSAGDKFFVQGDLVYVEDFQSDIPAIWVEGNRERVRVEEGRLMIDSNDPEDRVLTVFVDRRFKGDLYFEYEAEILASDSAADFPEPRDVNNLNTFLYYADPAGADLKTTKEGRKDGAYSHYHNLNGYIVTFLNGHLAELREKERNPAHVVLMRENTGRIRLRENPGFILRNEVFLERSESGRIYRMQFILLEGELFFFIDDRFLLSFRPSPEKLVNEGYFAFRTFSTRIAVDRFLVRNIALEPPR